MESEEITSRTCADYVRSGQYLMDCLGRQRHVKGISLLDRTRLRARAGNKVTSPYTVTKLITVIRQRFKWAYEVGLIEHSGHHQQTR